MGVYDRQIETAKRLIAKNGQLVEWNAESDSANVNSPWDSEDLPPVKTNVRICFLPVDLNDLPTFGYANLTDVPQGAVKGLMGAVPFEPKLKDWVMRDGRKLNIDQIKELSPNGEKILFTILFKD